MPDADLGGGRGFQADERQCLREDAASDANDAEKPRLIDHRLKSPNSCFVNQIRISGDQKMMAWVLSDQQCRVRHLSARGSVTMFLD